MCWYARQTKNKVNMKIKAYIKPSGENNAFNILKVLEFPRHVKTMLLLFVVYYEETEDKVTLFPLQKGCQTHPAQ